MSDGGKLKGLVKSYMIFGVVGILCVIYAVIGTLDIQKNQEARLILIIGDMMVPYIFGIAVTSLLREQGLLLCGDEPSVLAAEAEHERMATLCAPMVQALAAWCQTMTADALKLERMRILADEGLIYERHFPDGEVPVAYEPHLKEVRFGRLGCLSRMKWNRMERKRERAFYRAAAYKIKPLAPGELISEGHKAGDPFYLGRSQAAYRKQTFERSLVTKPVIALCMGYLTVRRIEDFDPMTILWQIFGVAMFVAFGVLSMLQAMDYKKNEYTGRMIKKTGYLKQFWKEKGESENGEVRDLVESDVGGGRSGAERVRPLPEGAGAEAEGAGGRGGAEAA